MKSLARLGDKELSRVRPENSSTTSCSSLAGGDAAASSSILMPARLGHRADKTR